MSSEIILYNTEDGKSKIELHVEDGTVWLNIKELARLFATTRQNIAKHIKNIFDDGELYENRVCNYKLHTTEHGAISAKTQTRKLAYYNLDMILAIGYRVRSVRGVQFRNYASTILKEYLIKGFTMDDGRLKNLGGGAYWKELLERIRDIRSSEKVMYRQVLDLYATSIDYDPKSRESIAFFKMVQNKLHYAVHGQTAAELIYKRADSTKEFMGLTTFSGAFPTKKDIGVAKNYLMEDELKILNRLVAGYFEIAEMQAMKHKPMYMSDYVETLDNILASAGEDVLKDAGKISYEQAMEKALFEYKKYQAENLSPVEKDYLAEIKSIEEIAQKGGRKDA